MGWPVRSARFRGGYTTSNGTIRPELPRMRLHEAAALLYGLMLVDIVQLRGGLPPVTPALHTGRLTYQRQDPGEQWRDIRSIWAAGGGDCEDLAAAVAAELVVSGVPARPILYYARPGLAHAVVHRLDTGVMIDPSRTGGMGRP